MPKNDNPSTDEPTEPADSTQESADADGDGGGGEGGDDAARRLRNAQSAAKRAAQERDRFKAELAELRNKQAPASKPEADAPVDAKAIAEAAKAEARAELAKDRALDKIEVLAAKTFANPELAVRLLRSDVDGFVSEGRVDNDAIKDALADLLDANPYLAAAPAKRFQGSGDGGFRSDKPAPDLDAQIAEARAKGDVRRELDLQNSKLLPQLKELSGFGGT